MSSRSRTRAVKAAGVTTVRIPRQRGRRAADPFVIVVPERPSLTRQALTGLALILWNHRRALAPTGAALSAFLVTALLHALAWWSGLVLAPLVVAPALWLGFVHFRRPSQGSAALWRVALALLATLAFAWVALAAWFGPLAGPLELVWLLTWLVAQTAWLIVRRTH
ncbi:hypothetical protein YWIDRAFT_01414 [Streptomyces sp. SceaMP-e96]|uniref:hypothetical protein n=1 Tax=unclassified Streptomyces TaxID=2593676 RepID=UPI0008238D58|nr:hypothetical protein [Streptomyces sp. SceaMP-e96]MYT12176.1 hypothetical protein [Streptomyces sp. SID4951]SCK28008.1 hypothetical protein YWIDRAFT_01414 [Streptomyces sp. SceaMP-e96]